MKSINLKLLLSGISEVAQVFKDKGYVLADETLHMSGDKVEDIKLLLGNDNSHLVPQKDVLFGGSSEVIPSVYLESPLGVILVGDIERYKQNLALLPDRIKHSSEVCVKGEGPLEVDSNLDKDGLFLDSVEELKFPACTDISVLNKGHIVEAELERAAEEILSSKAESFSHSDSNLYDEDFTEENRKVVEFALENTCRDRDGRLVMPLLWNGKVAHLLGKNQNLSKAILKSNFKKFSKKDNAFQMIDEVFKEQEQLGIIERVSNLEQFLEENPQHSFLPHMPLFKMDRESTKCRNVFLSNLCESDKDKPITLSHNQAIFAGPCLNKKISTSILQLRFNEKLLCFDIKKAFLMIKLVPSDQSRLLFYWYRNLSKKDYSLIVY
ncbi:uncharacterized protein [Palaemon carinicauda]|uniref:uncharacterized protein n=1 Tax=Palaemon carinicauda TaxID=392227 RepID=UPI0035B5FF79